MDWLYSGNTSAAVEYSPPRRAAPVPEVYDDYPADDGYQQDYYADEAYPEDVYEDAAVYDQPAVPRPPVRRKSKKRSVGRLIAQWVAIVVATILVLAMGMGAYYLKRASDTISNVSGEDCGLACALGEAGNVAGLGNSNTKLRTDANGRTNVLILGTSDGRWDGEGGGSGDWLTDSIMIASVSEADQNAYMISIPRDLWIQYPKACLPGYTGRINALYQCMGGGAKTVAGDRAALIATIPTYSQITGLQIQYAVNINYYVLTMLVDALGGTIPVTIKSDDPRGIYDRVTGAKVPNGTSTIDSVMALNLARSRNSEGGYGMSSSNYAREQVQQAIARGLVQQAQANGFLTNLSGVSTAMKGIGDSLRTTLSADELVAALNLAKSVPASNFHSISLLNAVPQVVGDTMINEQSVVSPSAGMFNYTGIQRYIRTCLTAGPMADENAKVDVLNATGQAGLAASWKAKLKEAGFEVAGTDDYKPPTSSGGPSPSGPPTATGTSTGAGSVSVTLYQLTEDKPLTAAALAKQLGVAPIPGPVPGYTSPNDADFVVILGL